MTAINGVKYKLMPESLEINLEKIKKQAQKIVEEFGGQNKEYEIIPVAFGLKALIVFFVYSEDKDIESMDEKLAKISGVASVQMIDMRKVA